MHENQQCIEPFSLQGSTNNSQPDRHVAHPFGKVFRHRTFDRINSVLLKEKGKCVIDLLEVISRAILQLPTTHWKILNSFSWILPTSSIIHDLQFFIVFAIFSTLQIRPTLSQIIRDGSVDRSSRRIDYNDLDTCHFCYVLASVIIIFFLHYQAINCRRRLPYDVNRSFSLVGIKGLSIITVCT